MTTRPQAVVLAGINGAGKTSASRPLLLDALKIPSFTNADTIALGLSAFGVEAEAAEAGRIMLEHLRDLAARRQSFAFETTLSGRTYARWPGELVRDGYAVHLFYYWLRSAELAIRRVADRVRAGGHHIPDETIRRRYPRSVQNFMELYRPVVTTWQVYDNSTGERRLIAFGSGDSGTVVDAVAWAALSGVPVMAEQPALPAAEPIGHAAVDRAHALANRDGLLEHARLGRSVSQWLDGKIVTVMPAEIFARYGLDESGRPKPETKEELPVQPDDPLLLTQLESWREAEQFDNEGKFDQYRGEYVFFANGTVFGHGRNLADLRPLAEERAAAAGISPDRLVDYFVPAE